MANRVPVQLPPGLKSDDTSYSTQGFFRNASNMRFVEERPEVIRGWERVSPDYVPGVIRNIIQWRDNIRSQVIALGSNNALYLWLGGIVYNITPAAYQAAAVEGFATAPGYGLGDYGAGPYGTYNGIGDYSIKTWSFANLGQSLFANPRLDDIYWWQNNTSVVAQSLSDIADATTESGDPGSAMVPRHVNCIVVTKNRQLIAFACEDQGVTPGTLGDYNPLLIRGSDLDGGVASWDATDRGTLAFRYILPNGGAIIAAKLWGDIIGVWTDIGLYQGTYTGDPTLLWRWDPIAEAGGLVGPNAVEIVGQQAYWISKDYRLWQCSGTQASMIESPIFNDTLANIAPSQGDKVVMTHLVGTNELRIDYPHADDAVNGAPENSRYVLYHFPSNTWSAGLMSRTAFNKGEQFPLGADASVQTLGSLTVIDDNASAALALRQAQKAIPSISGNNLVLRDNTAFTDHVGVQDLPGSQSGWGFVFVGNGTVQTYGELNTLTTANSVPMSISFEAQVLAGAPQVEAEIGVYNQASGLELIANTNITIQRSKDRFTLEGVELPVNASNVVVRIGAYNPFLPNGATLNITDIKIQQDLVSTEWTPNPNDPDLYDLYGVQIREYQYDQVVSRFYFHEKGNTGDGGPIPFFIETNDFTLDEDYSAFQVSRFIPDFINQLGVVQVTIFSRLNPQDTDETQYGPFALTPGEDRIDFRGMGKIFRIRISGSGMPAGLRWGRPMFELTPAGTR